MEAFWKSIEEEKGRHISKVFSPDTSVQFTTGVNPLSQASGKTVAYFS